jgi:glycosyltransferase involved in cell wall biosynthesis
VSLVIHAPNVHSGGGRTLLLSLLASINRPATIQVDERLAPLPIFNADVKVIRVAPRLFARWRAERRLRSLGTAEDVLLCFGNLPPLFRSHTQVFVYLQNRYLTNSRDLSGFSRSTRLRIRIERLWLRLFLRDATLLVQTETMAEEVRTYLQRNAKIVPFAPLLPDEQPTSLVLQEKRFDYLYVASGEPHKNHRRLIEAWVILAQRDLRPSLLLTLDALKDAELVAEIEAAAHKHRLMITCTAFASEQMPKVYAQCRALVFPSLFESFGLPLIEAAQAGIPIVAAEFDYVRDVVRPNESFDPNSALSIARAVLRHQGQVVEPRFPGSASDFLTKLGQLN